MGGLIFKWGEGTPLGASALMGEGGFKKKSCGGGGGGVLPFPPLWETLWVYLIKLKIGMLHHMNNTFRNTIFMISVNVSLAAFTR